MKILHVTQGYDPAMGGTELMVQRVSEELVHKLGDEVTVFTTNCYSGDAFYTPGLPTMPIGWDDINGVRVRRFPVYSSLSRLFYPFRPTLRTLRFPGNQYFRTLYNGPIIPGLAKAIRAEKFDILMAASFPLLHMYVSLKTAHRMGLPCVLQGGLHPEDAWGFQRPMIYQAIQQADHYLANTEFERQYVIERGAHPEKVSAVGLGVDRELFEATDPYEAKQRFNLGDDPVVGFIGQIGAHKGVDTLLRAMPRVWKEVPEAKLLIAGARTLFAEALEASIQQLTPAEQARIILYYNFANEEKPWLFAATDIFAYPSGFESFGVAFVEAWAVKKPVIGCRRGAVPWVVDAGRDGLLVEFQNEKLLAEAILQLLKNPEWARSLGEAGYQKMLTRYNWPETARRYRAIYRQVVENYRASLG
jgi:glycosyltransferase involved in cell wall biosynthesis